MTHEELKPTTIPNVNFTVVMNLNEHNGKPHPQLFLMVTDKESVNTLKEFFPKFERLPDRLETVEEDYNVPLDVAKEGYKIIQRIFGMHDESKPMPPLDDAYSKFRTIEGYAHEGLKLDEDYSDTEKGSFLYLFSDFLYQALFNTQPEEDGKSIIDYIKEGKLEVTFVPGFLENFEKEIIDAWDAYYTGFSNMYSPDYELYLNSLMLFDSFLNALLRNGVCFEYDSYFDEEQEYRDNNAPGRPLHNIRLMKREPHKPMKDFPTPLITVQQNIEDVKAMQSQYLKLKSLYPTMPMDDELTNVKEE